MLRLMKWKDRQAGEGQRAEWLEWGESHTGRDVSRIIPPWAGWNAQKSSNKVPMLTIKNK